jgi:hypothetical protein
VLRIFGYQALLAEAGEYGIARAAANFMILGVRCPGHGRDHDNRRRTDVATQGRTAMVRKLFLRIILALFRRELRLGQPLGDGGKRILPQPRLDVLHAALLAYIGLRRRRPIALEGDLMGHEIRARCREQEKDKPVSAQVWRR